MLPWTIVALISCQTHPVELDTSPSPIDTDAPPTVASISATLNETIGSIVEVTWHQGHAANGHVAYQVDGEWRETPSLSRQAGEQTQLLLGIPYGTEVSYSVVIDDVHFNGPATITTDEMPAVLFPPELSTEVEGQWDDQSPYFLLSYNELDTDYGGPWWTVIVDRKGRLVWALPTPETATTLYARPSSNGQDLLIDHNSFWVIFDSVDSEVMRLKIDGSIIQVHDTPYMGHAFVDLPDGTIVWVNDEPATLILMKRTNDEDIEEIWSCANFLETLDCLSEGCGTNTMWWDPNSDHFFVSSFSNESVMEIDHQTGTLVRYFGHLPGAWGFSPLESTWWWQHGPTLTPEGNLLISARISEKGNETVVREYAINEETETLEQVWSFGEGEGVYGATLGEAHRLANGNTLHNYGSHARLREVTPAGEVVWELYLGGNSHSIGHSTPLNDLYAFVP